jgi:DNA-damage-inducible protein J
MRNSRATKTDYIRARIEPTLKEDVEGLFDKLGITTTQAITMFYKQVQSTHELPFNFSLNKETLREIKEAKQGKGLTKCKDTQDLFEQLEI